MPIKVHSNLPAKFILENENIFIMDEKRAIAQDIRPLKIAILNLMPLKEETEVQLLRCLSNTPLQVDVTFLTTASYNSKNTAASHLNQFYLTFDDVEDQKFDGLIITGAPVEQMNFEDVTYWDELTKIMDWAKTNVTSTLHICWGALAGLYYNYGVQKHMVQDKISGIYDHKVLHRKCPLMRGFDDVFFAPHSRYTKVYHEDLENLEGLTILAESDEAGVLIAIADSGKEVYVLGHPEYDRMTLDSEYKRDIEKGMDVAVPKNYYPDDDPTKRPLLQWRGHSNALYTNWLNYYVYQNTPYEW